MVCETWRVARSSVYALRARLGGPPEADRRQPGKRGPKTALSDEELVEEIQTVLKASPFLGEGHRKVKARLAAKGIRVGKNRVLRLMREHGLLAPVRRGHPRGDDPQRPDLDREAGRTLGRGRVAVLDEGGGLVLVLRGRRPLHLGRRRLARCEEGRPLGGGWSRSARGCGPAWAASARPSPWASVCGTTGARSTGHGSASFRSGTGT